MGLRFLDGKSWAEVTREERVFCQHLYVRARDRGLKAFVEYINAETALAADPNAEWELAYEACFYRDLWHHRGRKHALFSKKRTFDLCLLSDAHVIVVEAKAQQGFDDYQVAVFARDKEQVRTETNAERVSLLALASSRCPVPNAIRRSFDGLLTWRSLATWFDGDSVLIRADDIYETPRGSGQAPTMTGDELVLAHAAGRKLLVGRNGGVEGKLFAEDLARRRWRTHRYATDENVQSARNENWFPLDAFVTRVTK